MENVCFLEKNISIDDFNPNIYTICLIPQQVRKLRLYQIPDFDDWEIVEIDADFLSKYCVVDKITEIDNKYIYNSSNLYDLISEYLYYPKW